MSDPFDWNHKLLYGILDFGYLVEKDLASCTAQLIDGGVTLLQLRAKGLDPDFIAEMASRILPVCRSSGVPLIINDYPKVAHDCGADGVHIGQDDSSVEEARKLLGPGRIVGKSTHSLAQATVAQEERPDYIGFGPLFATPTKPEYTPVGLSELKAVHREVSLPVFCIGGIKLENLPEVLAAGARRVVIVSGLLQAGDRSAYAQSCLTLLKSGSILS